MNLRMDIQAAIKVIESKEGSSKIKHVDVRLKFISSKVKTNKLHRDERYDSRFDD